MRLRSICCALFLGTASASAQTSPAAIFLTWDGDPTTTVSVDWHLAEGNDVETVEIRGPGVPRWTRHSGGKFQFPHSTRSVRRARITNLRPGSTYELRVGASRVYSYRTMPARLTRPVRFATGGDTHADDARFGSVNRYVARQDVDFVLLGGDLAYSNGDPRLVAREEMWFETAYKTLVTPQGRLIPVIAAIGNHEVFSDRDTTQATRDMIARTGVKLGEATYYKPLHAHARDKQYSVIDVGDYLSLVLLNTAHTAAIAGEQTAWLRDVLAARPVVPHVFPVYHVPGFPSVRAFSATNSTLVRENWAPLFERASVRVAFENHDHAYKRTYPIRDGRRDSTGVIFLGDGAWGAGARPIGRDHKGVPEWYLEKTASVNHAIIVTIDEATARFDVRDTTGARVDTLRVTRRPTAAVAARRAEQDTAARRWLAGDHHIHSQYSVSWNDSTTPPSPIIAGDAKYPIPTNAEMAKKHGLSWMVSTDHGGPNHSKVNMELAYPELVRSRTEVPGILQFYGMEFDTPGADHSSLIVPHSHHERTTLHHIETRFSSRDAFPRDSTRNAEPRMLDALRYMRDVAMPPVLIANHPSRSATGMGVYGLDKPSEFRDWNDTAPRVAVGMEGAPGHQAGAINRDGSLDSTGARGGYRRQATMGGFDQMTARVGGFWDSMLGEGRRWWITSTSDSHKHWRDGGSDFWPGEYSKTYVHAAHTYDDILGGIRSGRVFVTTGDLVSEVHVTAETVGPKPVKASIGGALPVPAGRDVRVTIRVRDPQGANHNGDRPDVARVDLIVGEVTGPVTDRTKDTNATTRVVQRFDGTKWKRDGEWLTMTHTLKAVHHSSYLRVRGTSTAEAEPTPDPLGENPWSDLWFYSNPIFMEVGGSARAVMVPETFITPFDSTDNVDGPAVWHGPNGQHWLLSSAKSTNVILVNDAATGATIRRVGGTGAAAGQLSRPNGLAVIGNVLLVVERDNHRVQGFQLPGLTPIGTFGDTVLRLPYGIGWHAEGPSAYMVYVTDNYERPDGSVPPDRELGQRVKQFRVTFNSGVLQAKHVRSFGDTTGAGSLRVVESIMPDAANRRLLIAEETETDSHIKVYDLGGRFTGKVFGRGHFPQQAEGIALYACGDRAGYWIATDQGDRVNTYNVFDRMTFAFLGAFSGERTRRTDGVALTQKSFGPFPAGAFYGSHLDGGIGAMSWAGIATMLRLRSDCGR